MPGSPFFVQRCPSCCRQLRIDVNYLGLNVICQHCDKGFTARDPSAEPAALMDPISYWIQQADHALGDDVFGRAFIHPAPIEPTGKFDSTGGHGFDYSSRTPTSSRPR